MKTLHRLTRGLLAIGTVAMAWTPAQAQTTANGPYYPPPSYDQTLTCTTLSNCPRFIVLSNFGSAAVLDRETGLVWEKTPDLTTFYNWLDARVACTEKRVGGRRSWRVPSVHELASLLDPNRRLPSLPAGHPFSMGAP